MQFWQAPGSAEINIHKSLSQKVDFWRQKSQQLAKNNGVFSIDEQPHKIPAHAVILWDGQ